LGWSPQHRRRSRVVQLGAQRVEGVIAKALNDREIATARGDKWMARCVLNHASRAR